jgi:uncharacterized protein YcbK (DUF882 family)
MKSRVLRRDGAAVAAILLPAFVAGFAMIATASSANAANNFWQDDKPSVTGRAPKAAAARARAYRKSDTGSAEAVLPTKKRAVRVASLGKHHHEPRAARQSVAGGGGLTWVASSGCLNSTLKSVVRQVAASYGPVTVNSTCRSRGHNAAVGGARRSQHLSGDAVDFRVHGNVRGAMAYLRSNGSVGGLKHYGGGLFHADTGPRRTW